MTNTTLEKIIDNVNQNKYMEIQYAIISIDKKVDLYNINEDNCIEQNGKNFYDFYLIKGNNSSLKYVGIIFDMVGDLHIFIKEEFRGKGYLQNTLNTSILPFLAYYKNRDKQDLTFEDETIKQYFIDKLGFMDNGYLSATKYISDLSEDYEFKNESSINISERNKEDMEKLLNHAILAIRILKRKLDYQKHENFSSKDYFENDLYWHLKDDIQYDD